MAVAVVQFFVGRSLQVGSRRRRGLVLGLCLFAWVEVGFLQRGEVELFVLDCSGLLDISDGSGRGTGMRLANINTEAIVGGSGKRAT